MTVPPQLGASSVVPTCYRHPSRETYIQCTRCGKNICPDCMRQASVGFQCPQCVREGSKGMRPSASGISGRRTAGDPMLMTKVLIGVNIAVFVLTSLSNLGNALGGRFITPLQQQLVLVPHFPHQWYRLITSGFIHFGFLHIALNMYALWIIGRQLEPALGRARYLVLYFISLLGGSALAFTIGSSLTGGASGAVFGLFAALYVIGRRRRVNVNGVAVIIGLNLVISVVFSGFISWQAHVGGLIAGAVIAAAFAYAPRGPARLPVQVAGVAVVLIASLVLIGSAIPASTVT